MILLAAELTYGTVYVLSCDWDADVEETEKVKLPVSCSAGINLDCVGSEIMNSNKNKFTCAQISFIQM